MFAASELLAESHLIGARFDGGERTLTATVMRIEELLDGRERVGDVAACPQVARLDTRVRRIQLG